MRIWVPLITDRCKALHSLASSVSPHEVCLAKAGSELPVQLFFNCPADGTRLNQAIFGVVGRLLTIR